MPVPVSDPAPPPPPAPAQRCTSVRRRRPLPQVDLEQRLASEQEARKALEAEKLTLLQQLSAAWDRQEGEEVGHRVPRVSGGWPVCGVAGYCCT